VEGKEGQVEGWGYYETIAGGAGAGPGWIGASGVHTHMTNTRITDAESMDALDGSDSSFREKIPSYSQGILVTFGIWRKGEIFWWRWRGA
jgi:hypothetical protein